MGTLSNWVLDLEDNPVELIVEEMEGIVVELARRSLEAFLELLS